MNWQKKLKSNFLLAVGLIVLAGCGVKGDPLPPEKPVEIGRGRPTYKRAVEDLKVNKVKPAKKKNTSSKSEDDSDDEE